MLTCLQQIIEHHIKAEEHPDAKTRWDKAHFEQDATESYEPERLLQLTNKAI